MVLGAQGRRKAAKRAVDMSPSLNELHAADMWQRPPADECEEDVYPTPFNDRSDERLVCRIRRVAATYELVEFAVVYQVLVRGKWCDVAEIDSCHDVDAHIHRYSRSTGERVGDPEPIATITCLEDVQKAYGIALDHVEQFSADLKGWWHHG